MKIIGIGYGNMISADRIVSVVSPDAAPIKRLVADGRADGRVIDASSGKATRSVIICDSDHIVLSALSPEELKETVDHAD